MKLVVLGGNGYVGRAICREAIKRGWQVASLSRSGAPPSTQGDAELQNVEWLCGSALDPSSYAQLLPADIIVHSIGTVFKNVEATNRDSLLVALQAIREHGAGVKAFGYISAADWSLNSRYSAMKREADSIIASERCDYKKVITKPAMIYGGDKWFTYLVAYPNKLLSRVTGGYIPEPVLVDSVAKSILDELVTERNDTNSPSVLQIKDIVAHS